MTNVRRCACVTTSRLFISTCRLQAGQRPKGQPGHGEAHGVINHHNSAEDEHGNGDHRKAQNGSQGEQTIARPWGRGRRARVFRVRVAWTDIAQLDLDLAQQMQVLAFELGYGNLSQQ